MWEVIGIDKIIRYKTCGLYYFTWDFGIYLGRRKKKLLKSGR